MHLKSNLGVSALVQDTIIHGQGILSDKGALMINTGKFTGRSPKDRFIVRDELTAESVDWGEINIPIASSDYQALEEKILKYAERKASAACQKVGKSNEYTGIPVI